MEREPKFKVGDKIYSMVYEEEHKSYTIVGINEIKKDSYFPLMKAGILYTVHSDLFPNATGYHFIREDSIDTDDKYFSSPELAHKAYEKWKEKTGRKVW